MRGTPLQHHRRRQFRTLDLAAIRARKNVHIPLPLDHFFFCFFAPVAAGAILTDLLLLLVVDGKGRWDQDGRGLRKGKVVVGNQFTKDYPQAGSAPPECWALGE